MKKRILSLLLAGTLAVSLAVPALAAEDSAVKTYPVITQGETQYVPLRAIAEDMGFQVNWDQASETAIVSNDVYSVEVQPLRGTGQRQLCGGHDRSAHAAEGLADLCGRELLW